MRKLKVGLALFSVLVAPFVSAMDIERGANPFDEVSSGESYLDFYRDNNKHIERDLAIIGITKFDSYDYYEKLKKSLNSPKGVLDKSKFLNIAIRYGFVDLLKNFEEKYGKINDQVNSSGLNYMGLAVGEMNASLDVTIIDFLLGSGVDIDGAGGVPPIIVACRYDHAGLAGYLISRGANPFLLDPNGLDLYQISDYFSSEKCKSMILMSIQKTKK